MWCPPYGSFRRLHRHSWSWKGMLKICPELSQEGWGLPHPWVRVLCVWWARDLRHGHPLQMSEAIAEGNGNWRASTNCPPSCWWQPFTIGKSGCCPPTPLAQSFFPKLMRRASTSFKWDRKKCVSVCMCGIVYWNRKKREKKGERREWNLTLFSIRSLLETKEACSTNHNLL